MKSAQKIIKYLAIALAIFLIINIISAIIFGLFIIGNIANIINFKENLISNTKNNTLIMEEPKIISTENIKEISKLKIDLENTNLFIKYGDSFKVETNNSNIKFNENNGFINIKEKNNSWIFKNNYESNLTIYIPEQISNVNKLELNHGTGKVTIDTLKVNELSCNLGAGQIIIKDIHVFEKAKIEGGAGQIKIESGEINNLHFELGAGETSLYSKLTGNNSIEAGLGNLNIILFDKKENYKFNIDKGIGNIQIDNETIIKNLNDFGQGKNYIKINGGIGNININFE